MGKATHDASPINLLPYHMPKNGKQTTSITAEVGGAYLLILTHIFPHDAHSSIFFLQSASLSRTICAGL